MKITTSNPGLVLFLIDGSHSTGVTWGNGKQLLSESIMRQTNQFILDLIAKSKVSCFSSSEPLTSRPPTSPQPNISFEISNRPCFGVVISKALSALVSQLCFSK